MTSPSRGEAAGEQKVVIAMMKNSIVSRSQRAVLESDELSSDQLSVESEPLIERVNRMKARWLKRVMYETPATSTEKCFGYVVVDHLNGVTLDCWPGLKRIAQLMGCRSVKTPQRAARGLQDLGLLTVKRGKLDRYAPVFLPGDEDRLVRADGHPRSAMPDKDVDESLLGIHPMSSSSRGLPDDRKIRESEPPAYSRSQRGALEMRLASMLGKDGFDILARLARLDDAIVDRLCRALAEGRLGERELFAARLAVDQM
jgi:hypothetical protein